MWLLTFGYFLSLDCKLARGGPPATIVAIDEESRNGEWALCFMTYTRWISSHFNARFVMHESIKWKLQSKFTNSFSLISFLYGFSYCHSLEMLYLDYIMRNSFNEWLVMFNFDYEEVIWFRIKPRSQILAGIGIVDYYACTITKASN